MPKESIPKICSIEECVNAVHARFLCGKHYRRLQIHGDPLYTEIIYGMSLEDKLDKYCTPITETGCWLWTGCTDKDGYGITNANGASIKAHRAAYEIANGEIPDGLIICHTCDISSCVNPNHLYAGTYKENSNDMVARGRSLTGERNHKAKLTETAVINIRSMAADGRSIASIARLYGVSWNSIDDIVKRDRKSVV